MKISFNNQFDAFDWIADFAIEESQAENFKTQVNHNFIQTGNYFLILKEASFF